MQAYLFVHFKEKTTPDGEQVYFGLSRDGFHWEEVNGGNPVLWTYYGDKGAVSYTHLDVYKRQRVCWKPLKDIPLQTVKGLVLRGMNFLRQALSAK